MRLSESIRVTSAVLCAALLAVASCMVQPCELYAQDFEAVERRLGGAIEAGELSLQQASVMMEALRHSFAESQHVEARTHHYEHVAREIREAHEAGKISEEEAEEKLIRLRREMLEREHHERKLGNQKNAKRRNYELASREILEALKAGKISKEEAKEKSKAMQLKIFKEDTTGSDDVGEDMKIRKQKYMIEAEEIEAAVKSGKVSKREASARLHKLQRAVIENGGH